MQMKKIVTFNRKGFLTELNNLKINTVAKLKAKLKSTLKNEVQENLHAALPNVDGETVAAWKKFKNEITIYTASVNPVNKNDLPQEVYEAVMQGVIARDDSIKSKIELGSIDGETIKRVGRWFSSFANNDEVIVPANGENYTITMFMNASAQIAFADKNCTLSGWNVGTSAKKAINSFIKDLQSYVEDYRINIWRELLKDAAGALLDEFIDELGELHDGVAKDLFEKLKNYIELESESSDVVGGTIDQIFELIPATKNLIDNIEKNYKTFIEKLNALVDYSQTAPDDADDILTAKQYNAFVSCPTKIFVWSKPANVPPKLPR